MGEVTRDGRETPGPVESDGTRAGMLERRPVHQGRIVDLSVDRVRFPDGSEGEREVVRHRGAAAVLAFFGEPGEPDADVLMLRQYRYAAGRELLELPAGMPEGEESWEACAARELEEETGWRAGRLRRLTRIFTTPGFTNEVIHLFAGWELERGRSGLDDDEFLETVRVPFSRAIEWVREGRVEDGKSVSAILYGALFLGTGTVDGARGEDRPTDS